MMSNFFNVVKQYRIPQAVRSARLAKKLSKLSLCFGLLSFTCTAAWPVVAGMLSDSMIFSANNQNMWGSDNAGGFDKNIFIGQRWGTYTGNSHENWNVSLNAGFFGVDVASARMGMGSSGEIGLIAEAKTSGGKLDLSLPVNASIELPDHVEAQSWFNVSTQGGVLSNASIAAFAPSFSASLDGVFNSRNHLVAEVCGRNWKFEKKCAEEKANLNLELGQFSILGLDTADTKPLSLFGIGLPQLKFDKEYIIRAPSPKNPDGIETEDEPPSPPSQTTPIIGQVTMRNLQDMSGGQLTGNALSFSTNQNLLELEMSITGLIELGMGSPGVLRNETTVMNSPCCGIPSIKAQYTIADVLIGPSLGLQQNFSLNTDVSVQMQFDQPVTRMESVYQGLEKTCRIWWGNACVTWEFIPFYEWQAIRYDDGLITAQLGDDMELMFEEDIGQLISREYFLEDPVFSNQTAFTIDPGVQIKLFCAKFTSIDEKCLFDEQYQSNGLFAQPLFEKSWQLKELNEVKFNDIFAWDSNTGSGDHPPTAVPEPTSLLLFILAGLAAVLKMLMRALSPLLFSLGRRLKSVVKDFILLVGVACFVSMSPAYATTAPNLSIDVETLAKQALLLKLENSPATQEKLIAARNQVLAQAYIDSVGLQIAVPSAQSIQAFYQQHPELFSQRATYKLQEINIMASAEQLTAAKQQYHKITTLGDMSKWLQQQAIPFNLSIAIKNAEDISADLLAVLTQLQTGQTFTVPTASGFSIVQLSAKSLKPKSLQQARPEIIQVLRNKSLQTQIAALHPGVDN